jgi:hypothetical protein
MSGVSSTRCLVLGHRLRLYEESRARCCLRCRRVWDKHGHELA